MVIQTPGLIDLFQNCITVAAALISAGTVMAMVYPSCLSAKILHRNPLRKQSQSSQKFHPVAAPSAGSTNFVACRMNPPVPGMNAVISPVVYETPAVTNPITTYANRAPAGPAVAIACPELRKRPVPC
jgi:hypothetical protein